MSVLCSSSRMSSSAVSRSDAEKIAVMNEETVGLVPVLAVATQHGAHGLCLLARVGKDQALAAARMLKDIAHTGVGVVGRRVGGVEKRLLGRSWDVDFALGAEEVRRSLGAALARARSRR